MSNRKKINSNVQSSPTIFSDFQEEPLTSIQFSYPRVDNITLSSNSFFIPNSSTTPSFSLTDGKNNQFISGTAVKGYIASNNIKSNPELIIEHQSANTGTKFYVVIPLARDSNTKSTLSKLNTGSSVSLDLNSDIPLKNTVYHYLEKSTHVFVFDKPITIGANQFKNVSNNVSTVPALTNSSTQKYKIKSNTKVEDEVVCGSVEPDTATTKTTEDKKNTTIVYSFGMFLVCIVLIGISMKLIMDMKPDNRFYFIIACIPVFSIFLFLFLVYRTKINYAIIFGSLAATLVIIGAMALFPNTLKIIAPPVVAPTSVKAASIENPAFKALKL